MKRASRIIFALVIVFVGVIAAGVAILKSMDFNEYRDLIAEKVEGATGRQVTISGDLDLGISLIPTLRLEGMTFANADWGSRPEMANLESLEASVELIPLLSGEARINRVVLSGLDLLVETDADGRGNWEFSVREPSGTVDGRGTGMGADPASEAGGGLPVEPVIQEVVLENVRVTYRDGATGESYEVAVDALSALAEDRSSPIEFDGKGRLSQAPFALEGRVGSLAAILSGAGFPFAATGSVFDADFDIEGETGQPAQGTGLDVRLSLKSENLSESMTSFAAVVPALAESAAPETPAEVSGHLRQTDAGYAVSDFGASLGESRVSGTATVDLAADRPRVTAELSSPWLDLAALLPGTDDAAPTERSSGAAAPSDGSGNGQAGDGRIFPADPLDLGGLRAADANVTLKVEQFILPNGINLEKVMAVAVLDRGRLTLSPVRMELADGMFDGTIGLDARNPDAPAALDISLSGSDVVVGKLLEQLDMSELIRGGPTDVDIKLKGQGRSVREIMASLDGGLTIEVGEGRLYNKALDMAGGDAVMQILGAITPGAEKEEYSVLSCAVVNFDIKDGLAKADNGIAMETEKVNVVGAGSVNLADEKLDLVITPEAREGLGVSVGSLVAGLVRVTGTLAEPRVGIDSAGAAKTAVSIGAAIATGGLSTLGEALLSRTTRDPHPCLTALGKASPPETQGTAPADQESGRAPAPAEDPGKAAKEAIEGVGKSLRNLFGGGN